MIVCAESPLYEEHIQKLVDSPYPIPSVRLLVGKEEEVGLKKYFFSSCLIE